MVNVKEITTALAAVLPSDRTVQLEPFAQLLAEAIERHESSVDLVSAGTHPSTIHRWLAELAGQPIIAGQTVLSFGSGNQFGDITIGTIAGGNVYDIHLVLPPVPRFEEPNPERPPNITAFVGRADELAKLQRRLNNDHLAVIVGMPGQGKSTLAIKLATSVAAPEMICWHKLRPDAGFDELISGIAEFLATKDDRSLWEHIQHTYRSVGKGRNVLTLINQVERLLCDRGYLLCLDNFEVASDDLDIRALGERLCSMARDGKLSLIITSRERPHFVGYQDCWMLEGLQGADIRTLLVQSSHEPDLAAPIHAATSGNAFFVHFAVELLRTAPNAEGLLDELYSKPDVREYLKESVYEKLTKDEQAVVQAVSVLGEYPGTRDAIAAIACVDTIQIKLDDLVRRNLLQEADSRFGKEYSMHQIFRRYCYRLLDRDPRTPMHLLAGAYYKGSRESDRLRAAFHYAYGEAFDNAVHLAASKDNTWAIIVSGQAGRLNTLLEKLAQEKRNMSTERWHEVLVAQGRTDWVLGSADGAREHFQAAYTYLGGDTPEIRRQKAQICVLMGRSFQYKDPSQALKWVDQGLKLIHGDDANSLRAELEILRGVAYIARGDFVAARQVLQDALATLDSTPSLLRIQALMSLSTIENDQGKFAAGAVYARDGLALCDVEDSFSRITLLNNLAVSTYSLGDWPAAMRAFAEASTLAEQLGMPRQRTLLNLNIGLIAVNTGDDDLAQERLDESLKLARAHDLHDMAIGSLVGLADLHLRRGELINADRYIREAQDLAASSGINERKAEILRYRAELLLVQGDLASAVQLARQAVRLSRAAESADGEGMSLRTQGKTFVAEGRLAEGQRAEQRLKAGHKAFKRSATLLKDDPYELARTRMVIGELLCIQRRIDEGMQLLSRVCDAFKRLGAPRDLAEAETLISKYRS